MSEDIRLRDYEENLRRLVRRYVQEEIQAPTPPPRWMLVADNTGGGGQTTPRPYPYNPEYTFSEPESQWGSLQIHFRERRLLLKKVVLSPPPNDLDLPYDPDVRKVPILPKKIHLADKERASAKSYWIVRVGEVDYVQEGKFADTKDLLGFHTPEEVITWPEEIELQSARGSIVYVRADVARDRAQRSL